MNECFLAVTLDYSSLFFASGVESFMVEQELKPRESDETASGEEKQVV